ncbi:MAG TPA: PLDc N-terminal domain-containing protein [Sphingobacterium sp.]|nr:PLDc N-terminal domain-containing protein [Sphingobacterium sp.]
MNLLFIGTHELLIVLPLFLVFVYTLYHAITNLKLSVGQRILWILIIFVGNVLGWLAYWLIGKNTGKSK